jgi:hypothetical protein
MSRFEGVKCDECGAVKKDANHWWQVELRSSDAVRRGSGDGLVILLMPWVPDAHMQNSRDLCSQDCVQRTVAKYLHGELKP